MEYRRLGKSELEVSVVGIGAWAIGGHVKDWGPVDDNESIAAIREGITAGVNFIDTAPSYGYGHSEEVVGRAIAGPRDRLIIATKCGLVWRERGGTLERNLSPESIRRECEASLRRLRVETIDLYEIHYPDPHTPIVRSLEALVSLREQGKIRAIGAYNLSVDQLSEARKAGPVQSVQTELSLLDRSAADDLLPYCRERGIGVLSYGSLARGLLTAKFHPSSTFSDLRRSDPKFQGEAYRQNLRTVERLRAIAGELGRSPAQLALRWAIQQPGLTAVVAGVKRVSQVRDNAAAGEFELPLEAIRRIESETRF